jgi:hypothetical protein
MASARGFVGWRAAILAIGLLAASIVQPLSAFADSFPAGIVVKGLVAVGRLPADMRDKFGETTISASGITADANSWRRIGDRYHGVFYLLPDRGWNVKGTTDYRPRIHRFSIAFKPADGSSGANVIATLQNTIMLTDANGRALTGLDPVAVRRGAYDFPHMPEAINGRISLDPESIVLARDGSFFIGDEYGPYIYRFSRTGRMIAAIRPPDAFIPRRNGQQNFSSNNPGPGAKAPEPRDPEFGRQNNQGFEGMAVTPDGKTLAVILQSATRQDGGNSAATRQNTRMLIYNIANLDRPKLVREHVVVLPAFADSEGKRRIAAQSELLALDDNHFLLLCRDSNNGYGADGAMSRYRRIEFIDTTQASNIAGTDYDRDKPVAPGGKLVADIIPATLTSFIDINDNSQLAKFGMHNGEPNDRTNLSEKWEAMTLVPALDPKHPHDFFLFVGNDNDFINQNGFQVGARYKDASGANVDTTLLVFRITLPKFSGSRQER